MYAACDKERRNWTNAHVFIGLILLKKCWEFKNRITILTYLLHGVESFLEIHPNIIHPSMPRSPQWSLSLRFPHQDPIHPPLLTHTRYIPSPNSCIIGNKQTLSFKVEKIKGGGMNTNRAWQKASRSAKMNIYWTQSYTSALLIY